MQRTDLDNLAYLEGAFGFAPVGILVVDSKGKYVLANPAHRTLAGEKTADYCIFDDVTFAAINASRDIRKVFGGSPAELPLLWMQQASGPKAAVQINGYPVFGKAGELTCAVFIFKDVTSEVTFKKKLTESESRYRSLYDSSILAIFACDVVSGTVMSANPGFLKLTGFTAEDVANGIVSWPAMTPPEYSHLDKMGIEALSQTGVCPPFEKEYIRKDGTRVPILIGAAAIEGNDREVVAYALDLSERKSLEQQYRHAQKMETLGMFAGSIAHDFNNMLSLILLHSEQALELQLPEQAAAELRAIQTTAERAARFTKRILDFSRKTPLSKGKTDLNSIVQDLKDMLGRLIGRGISLEINTSESPCFIDADQGQLEQLIMNLLTNARDAIAGRGLIAIDTGTKAFSATDLAGTRLRMPPGDYVELTVKDTGCGIAAENLDKIFEPFFTTKKDNRGTGLGLPTVIAIAQQSGGDILVESAAGKGTTFRIYFPVYQP